MVGSLHENSTGKIIEKKLPNPLWHTMGSWGSEVPVDDDYCYDDGDEVHDEGEEEIFLYQRCCY